MNRDALQYALTLDYQSMLFLGEVVLGVVLPLSLLLFSRVRTSRVGLFYSSVLVLLGFVAHRVNTAITSMEQWPVRTYIPSWQELSITFGLAAFGFVAFATVAKYFNVFGEAPHGEKAKNATPVSVQYAGPRVSEDTTLAVPRQ
jgi:Ni/Fe-hydrogenase subunit HybB-like protein